MSEARDGAVADSFFDLPDETETDHPEPAVKRGKSPTKPKPFNSGKEKMALKTEKDKFLAQLSATDRKSLRLLRRRQARACKNAQL